MVYSSDAGASHCLRSDTDRPCPGSGRRAHGTAPVRKDHPRPAVRRSGLRQLLRSRIASQPRSSRRAHDRLGSASGVVVIDEIQLRPNLFSMLRGAGGPRRLAGRFPRPGQRLWRPPPTGVREPCRSHGARGAWGVHDTRGGRQRARGRKHAVAPRRSAPFVPRFDRGGQRRLAARIHPGSAREGLSPMGRARAGRDHGTPLGHARALPCTDRGTPPCRPGRSE